MKVEGSWDLTLSDLASASICLCESAISVTLCDHEAGNEITVHLDAVGVGEFAAFLTLAGRSWCEAAKEALEEAAKAKEEA